MKSVTRTLTLVLFMFVTLAPIAFTQPTITATTIANDNSSIDVTFSGGVSSASFGASLFWGVKEL